MASLKTPAVLLGDAETLAGTFEYLSHGGLLYAPVDYETLDGEVVPAVERKCWVPLSVDDIQLKARVQFDTAFSDEKKEESFWYMVYRAALPVAQVQPWLLVRTAAGLRVLQEDGKLHEHDGSFVPNILPMVLNEDPDDKAEVLARLTEWLGDEPEEAMSLLRHLATALAPHWSAGKYILLIGEGRNGKSLLLTMMRDLFGRHNCSRVDRETISTGSTGAFDLNGKLLNLVMDGSPKFIKDSSKEKTVITGEEVDIRKLYKNQMSTVQTNALFIEGLNQEPRSSDKTSALQKRMIRYWFPRVYPEDAVFWKKMTSERMLGALLSLLVDNYVLPENKAIMLSPTRRSRQLQMEHMEDNSMAVQYIVHLDETAPLGAEDELTNLTYEELASKFSSWRLSLNDIGTYTRADVTRLFAPLIETRGTSVRKPGRKYAVNVRVVTKFKPEMQEYLDYLRGVEDATAVVDDGQV